MSASPDCNCPVCGFFPIQLNDVSPGKDWCSARCPNCGDFKLTGNACSIVEVKTKEVEDGAARLSHAIRKMQAGSSVPFLGVKDLERLIENTYLPNPQEQADNLLLWLGPRLKGLGDFAPYKPAELKAIIGAWHEANVGKLVEELESQKLVKTERNSTWEQPGLTLTFTGWGRYQELRRGITQSRRAFMAMPYNDLLLDRMYRECFKPAVQETGFELVRLDEYPEAGVIDNRMRAQIRTARFLIAELTLANHGAYWEAGFGEGLGRPVIYTCEKKYFNEEKPHFDTNHCQTVVWEETDLIQSAMGLKATIRATLPSEAIPEGD